MQTLTSAQSSQAVSSEPFLVIDGVSKVYPTAKGPYTVLDNISLEVAEGEFICVIGHSGCGKSTLLDLVSGFGQPTSGEVRLESVPIREPGPDRMVVFQNYSLLPWMSAAENVALAVNTVFPHLRRNGDASRIVDSHLAMVGLSEAADKKPASLSGGMKQRVSIARALALQPKVLILDEPFGALDPITKEELQEELLKIWQEHKVTVLMITHSIDEALFLADRVVMMTNGPAATIGEILDLPFPRPRQRAQLMEMPEYFDVRNHALDFLYRRFAHDDQ
ncbi:MULTISPECIES: nitrate ABC transporter ATP-binding protein [unclassified Cyanobium]|uniref:nitrate ABC transporter ATP-binding protein n=1 Tax=unclassified Cyanobium TaxID=2627006 RepID=UPI0020CBC4D3|nr:MULTISPECIES: nitrate ABC transporter ATP-binding protein [unclassified Cyanobium]MCP9834293.1 ATP-binding cassette domain-containing protein [Cyanobium sp. La Preciosa 7G6]MCP9937071.1 ATP-binding cassette domain-containing protein [Cyanobium sp. Aljojuca 7A6]